jgi:hypothetical protein
VGDSTEKKGIEGQKLFKNGNRLGGGRKTYQGQIVVASYPF